MKGIFRNIYVFYHYLSSGALSPHMMIFVIWFLYFFILSMWISEILGYNILVIWIDALAAGACTLPIYLKTRRQENVMEIINNPKYKSWKYKLLTVLFALGYFPFIFLMEWLFGVVKPFLK